MDNLVSVCLWDIREREVQNNKDVGDASKPAPPYIWDA